MILNKLNDVAKKAYCPYSNFRVAAIFEMNDASFHSGFNIENAAFPSGMCAERVCLYSMINNGIDIKELKIIHIFSPDSDDYLSPCGNCRQSLSEHINFDVEFRLYNKFGKFISSKFIDIFPFPVQLETIKGIKR